MEIASSNFVLFLLVFLVGPCTAQRRTYSTTTTGCEVNSCSYTRDTRAMDCEGRLLVCVPSNALYKQSESIKLAQNTISRIRQTSFSGYTRLLQLDISNNLISVLDPGAFRSVATLQTLAINFNQLTRIVGTAFSSLRGLRILQLQGNAINSIDQRAFQDLVGIRELNLAGNRLADLPDGVFSAMVSMRTLFLQENQLLPSSDSRFLRGLRGLQDIDLDGNRFSAIPILDGLSRLTVLDMTDSHVRVISNGTFRHAARLRDIVLSGNSISSVEPSALVGLGDAVELDLSNNAIAVLPQRVFAPLRNLEVLLLQNNVMAVLTAEHIDTLSSLRTLNLEGNRFARLPAMAALVSLSVFNAGGNLLETFDRHMLRSFPRLSKLQLTGNTLQCDCRLRALVQWFIASGPAHHPHEIPRCNAARPLALMGRRITSLGQGDLVCDAPVIRSGVNLVRRTAGTTVVLSCIISHGFPTPMITWTAPGGFVYSFGGTGKIKVTISGELYFERVTVRDQGEYICYGTNPAGTASASISLRVTPDLRTPPKNPPPAPDPPKPPAARTTRLPLPDPVSATKPTIAVEPTTAVVVSRTEAQPPVTENSTTAVPVTTRAPVETDAENRRRNGTDEILPEQTDASTSKREASESTPVSTDSNLRPNEVAPVCIVGHSGAGLLGAITCTFVFTVACTLAAFTMWRNGVSPSSLKSNNQKERLVNNTGGTDFDSEMTPTPPASVSSRGQRFIIPRSTAGSSGHSYDRRRRRGDQDSSLGSSYSFSEMSTESVSVSSREETARYVTTESVIDPVSVRMRQKRLAELANYVPDRSLSESEISAASYAPGLPSRVYANAAMVAQDPNYASLWGQAEHDRRASNNDDYESANNADSRIYIDVS